MRRRKLINLKIDDWQADTEGIPSGKARPAGEPLITGFDPAQMTADLSQLGLTIRLGLVSGKDRKNFSQRSNQGLNPFRIAHDPFGGKIQFSPGPLRPLHWLIGQQRPAPAGPPSAHFAMAPVSGWRAYSTFLQPLSPSRLP